MQWTTIIICLIIFGFISLSLPWIAAFFDMKMQGSGPNDQNLADILLPTANWPSLLIRVYPVFAAKDGALVYDAGKALIDPVVIISNGAGWGLIDFVFGLVISVIKRKSHRQTQET